MIKVFVFFTIFVTSLIARDLTPAKEIEMSGNVIDIQIVDDILYAATDAGTLEEYDIKNEKHLGKIQLKKIHDFMGDLIYPKVYSVDAIKDKKLLLAEGEHGAREVYIHENNTTTKVISHKDKLTINKAKFIDESHLFLGLLSNEVILFDLKNSKQLYKVQLSQSKFSDFALNEDKTQAVVSCESGINYVVDVKSGKMIKKLEGGNKDNVFKVDFKNNKVSAAGQDRVGSVYDLKNGNIETFKAPFLIYSTGLNADATKVAYAFGMDNEIAVFNLSTKTKEYNLKGQKSTLNSIVFYNKDTIYSGSDDKYIMKWSLK